MFLLSRLVRDANPTAFFAVAMAVYLGQVFLLLVIIAFKDASWVDGPALGIVAFVVTIVWQVFAMRALRRARVPVYDLPDGPEERRERAPARPTRRRDHPRGSGSVRPVPSGARRARL